MTDDLSTIDAAARARISVRQLRYWANNGLLHPVHDVHANAMRWPICEVERAEQLGVMSRTLSASTIFLSMFGQALDAGDLSLVVVDNEYDVVVSLRVHAD